jgi:glycosyltransferase involved in cell wall biosynthesis
MPLGWSAALADVAEPADLWHGMWAGSLPALAAMRRRHGGATIYDSRDLFLDSRDFANARGPIKSLLRRLERRWARGADRVITVNDPYAEVLTTRWGIPRPPVVMNCPERWEPTPGLDLIRSALGLPPERRIVLYQGGLMTDRGIEPGMQAILDVPDASLCLLGFGPLADGLRAQAAAPPSLGRVHVLAPVAPDALLAWTASADVTLMAIAPSSLNHRLSTPQKLFESLAAGVPVVASDLPAMATIVREVGAGSLCDPTSPASIATAIHAVLDVSPEERDVRRRRILDAAHGRYSWEAQVGTVLAVYRDLVPVGGATSEHTATARP